jgi:hypothetical protein
MNWLKHFLGIHIHYFGIIHRGRDGRYWQTCYECSAERLVPIDLSGR